MIALQFLGLTIPMLIMLFIYGHEIKLYNNGKDSSIWMYVLFMLSIFVFGFTLGTMVMS